MLLWQCSSVGNLADGLRLVKTLLVVDRSVVVEVLCATPNWAAQSGLAVGGVCGPMRSFLEVFGRAVERRAVLFGASVSTGTAAVVGVGGGSLVAEQSPAAYVVNGLLFGGLIGGGAVAAFLSSENRLLAAILTSGPVMALAVAVQIIRRFGPGEAVGALGLPLVMLLSASLASLGGVLGAMARQRRRSLLDPSQPRRRRRG